MQTTAEEVNTTDSYTGSSLTRWWWWGHAAAVARSRATTRHASTGRGQNRQPAADPVAHGQQSNEPENIRAWAAGGAANTQECHPEQTMRVVAVAKKGIYWRARALDGRCQCAGRSNHSRENLHFGANFLVNAGARAARVPGLSQGHSIVGR